jgi:hypothetical protein
MNTKKYDYTGYFSEGFAVVRLNGKYGFIDTTDYAPDSVTDLHYYSINI